MRSRLRVFLKLIAFIILILIHLSLLSCILNWWSSWYWCWRSWLRSFRLLFRLNFWLRFSDCFFRLRNSLFWSFLFYSFRRRSLNSFFNFFSCWRIFRLILIFLLLFLIKRSRADLFLRLFFVHSCSWNNFFILFWRNFKNRLLLWKIFRIFFIRCCDRRLLLNFLLSLRKIYFGRGNLLLLLRKLFIVFLIIAHY